jgi:ATP-dependent helicase/nuclease subunit A
MSRPFPHVAIRASAGSGKTYQLTNRYIRLLLDGESPDRILATTFTRKAAGEIVDRVLTRLAEAVLDAEACSVLAKAVGKPELTSAQVGAALLSTTSVLHRVNISTIDAFFAGIAKAFSLELGFPPQWDIVETSVDDAMRLEAVNATLDGELEAVVTLIRLLGRSEFDRSVASQVSDTVRGLHGVYLDAPDSAWHCLTPRTDPDLIWIEEILRQLEDSAGATGDQNGRMAQALYRNIEDARHGRWKDLIWTGPAKKVLEGSNAYWKQEIPQEIEDLLAGLIEQVRAILLKSLIDRGDATHKLLATFDEHLRELKHARAAMRFDDVTRALSTAALLGELDDVFFRLDGRIQHLLLDEFQDTSLAQWRVLRPLSQEVASHATGDRSVFLVGDVKQAIYGWRGGVADIFDTLDGDLPGLEWKPLDCSWRSALTIIKTVNYAFEGLQGNKALQGEQAAARQWQQGFKKHKTAKKDLPGYARFEVAPQPGDGEHGRDAVFRRAAAIAAELAGQCRGASIGILTRRNDAVRRMIHELRKLGVAASEEGGNPVTDSVAVTLILSLMRLADHPGDSVARFHVASSPLGESLELDNHVSSAARVSARVRKELVRDGYGACVLRWSEILAPSCDAREARRLGQLVRLAHRHDAAPTLRADDFIAFVESERVEDPATTDVRVMTIHKAKGLEFDIVVLPELDQRLVGQTPAVLVDSPSPTSPPTKVVPYANEAERTAIVELDDMAKKWRAGQVRESLSLLYVALTRAVHALYIVIEPRENKGKYPATFSGLLRSSLAQGAEAVAEKVLFDLGDENWFKTLSWAKPTSEPAAALIDGIGMMPSRKRSRGLPRTSPSAMEGGATLQLADLMRLDTGALRRGSIVHALFEQIEWLDDGMPDLKVLRAAARAAGASQEQIATYEGDFQRMLANPDVRRVLTRASYAQPELTVSVYRELPFALRDDKSLITGAMDRVVVRKYGEAVHDVEVLDYKTDGVDEQTLSAKVEHYRPQLDAYRKAAAQVFGVAETQVGAQLVFVNAGYVVDLK